MERLRRQLTAMALAVAVALAGWPAASVALAQEPAAPVDAAAPAAKPAGRPAPSAAEIQKVIETFAAKEAEFKRARDNYTYHQTFKVQELDADGVPMDRQLVVESDIIFSPQGKRVDRVTYAPLSTLRRISLSPEDERDLKDRVAFVVTTEELANYNVRFQGRQKVDELDTYVFRVTPRAFEKGERYFDGLVWVDDQELQVVKTYGKSVPDYAVNGRTNYSPRYETYRELVDGKYRFPTWTGADDKIPSPGGDIKFRVVVKYDNYKQFKSDVNITYGEEAPAEPARK